MADTYYVARDSVYLRRRGSTIKRQFVTPDEVPEEFLPEDVADVQTMLDAGQLVAEKPSVEKLEKRATRRSVPQAMDRLGPTAAGIYRRLGMRFPTS